MIEKYLNVADSFSLLLLHECGRDSQPLTKNLPCPSTLWSCCRQAGAKPFIRSTHIYLHGASSLVLTNKRGSGNVCVALSQTFMRQMRLFHVLCHVCWLTPENGLNQWKKPAILKYLMEKSHHQPRTIS